MKRELLGILACPACKSHPLELNASKMAGDKVVSGELVCPGCGRVYPVEDGIPDLLLNLEGWYAGSGSPETYNKFYTQWTPNSRYQAEHPWPYKVAIAKKARGLVLDVGCGYGCIARFIENGIFMDFSLVPLKKRWVGGDRPRVRANAECMPFRSEVFDTVVATELIEHTDNPHRFVEEVYRVLKEGGQFLLSFPWSDASLTHHFKRISKDMVHKWVSPPFTEYRYDTPSKPSGIPRGIVYAYK